MALQAVRALHGAGDAVCGDDPHAHPHLLRRISPACPGPKLSSSGWAKMPSKVRFCRTVGCFHGCLVLSLRSRANPCLRKVRRSLGAQRLIRSTKYTGARPVAKSSPHAIAHARLIAKKRSFCAETPFLDSLTRSRAYGAATIDPIVICARRRTELPYQQNSGMMRKQGEHMFAGLPGCAFVPRTTSYGQIGEFTACVSLAIWGRGLLYGIVGYYLGVSIVGTCKPTASGPVVWTATIAGMVVGYFLAPWLIIAPARAAQLSALRADG